MAANELDTFLKGPESAGPVQPESPAAAPEPEPSAAAVIPGTGTPEPAAQVKAQPEPEADDDADPPEPQAGEPAIPRGAFDAMRKERHDWKAKAIQEETRRSELERQLAEAKRLAEAPRPPQQYRPPPQQEEVPNPAIDPAGWMAYHERQLAHREMMQRANFSEMMLRKEIGSEKVDALLVEWHAATARDPTLVQRAAQQNDPYGWAHKTLESLRAMAEIGDDPAAWREAERERLRAEIAAAGSGGAPRVSPAAGMQP